MISKPIQGLLFDFDGVISSVMARVGWPFFQALKNVKPDMKREYIMERYYIATQQLLASDKVKPLYVPILVLKMLNIDQFSYFQRLRFLIQSLVMYSKSKLNVVPQEGAQETLKALGEEYKMGLVTTAERKVIDIAREKIPALNDFDVIITREDCTQTKPDPEGLIKGIKGLGLHRDKILYIGDLPSDIIASQRAKIKVVSVMGEFKETARRGLEELNPNYIIPMLKDLPDLLKIINSKK